MRRARSRMRTNAALAVVTTALGIGFGQSQGHAAVIDRPVYNPQTKSYFELVRVSAAEGDVGIAGTEAGMYWSSAQAAAQSRVFKGVHGRLAVVRDLPTTEWVEVTLQPPSVIWIGLRYVCNIRQLEWSDGTYFKRADWQIWDRHWYQGVGGFCQSQQSDWAGVTLVTSGQGVHWISWGFGKTFEYYLVEYPTGAP